MSTTMQNPQSVERSFYIIDAADKSLGRVAALAAHILRGKHKVTFTPHVDCGDSVIILNAEKIALTGQKLDQKKWYRHTGYVGGLKEVPYRRLMSERPEKAVELAVWGMLPSNSIGRKSLTRLKVYKGETHNHAAQNPTIWNQEV